MAFQPVPNVVKISFEGRMDAQDVVNSLYVQPAGGGGITAENVSDLTNLAAQAWLAEFLPVTGQQYGFLRTIGTDLTVPDGSQTIITNSAGAAGGINTGTALPNNCAFCVSLVTGLAGRSQRGRLYLAGLRSLMVVDGNTLTNGQANNYTAAIASVIAGFSSETNGSFRAVVVSRFTNGVQRPSGVAVPIAGVSARDFTVDSQRRRLPGRGV